MYSNTLTCPDMQKHKEWFNAYTSHKLFAAQTDSEPIRLKIQHSLRVLENAEFITASCEQTPRLEHICHVAALYHDLGRFDQYLRYGTFKDKDSLNHGLLSAKLIKKENRLALENAYDRHCILAAVAWHNRRYLPTCLKGDMLFACQVVRDADKLDILRVMDEHLSSTKPYNPTVVLSLPDVDAPISDAVMEAALNGRSAAYGDLQSVNDFRLLLGTWFFDMNFASSRRLFIKQGHARRILAGLPNHGPYARIREIILEKMSCES